MIRVGIWGVTGYAGYELARWLQRHPEAHVTTAVSESYADNDLAMVVPGPLSMPLLAEEFVQWDQLDVVFTALPHGIAARTVALAQQHGVRAIDLSADLRLDTEAEYRHWYGNQHPAPALLAAPYGLPELYREQLHDQPVIANPGCYPTAVLLGLAPLLEQHAVRSEQPVIINAASGLSGAGRGLKQHLHFVEANENFTPYAIGRVHRHVGEIEQELHKLAEAQVQVIFAPHILPVQRGILCTMYVSVDQTITAETLQHMYTHRYAAEPFVRILPHGSLPGLAHVTHTNMCVIGLTLAQPGLAIVTAALDNLVKGAAGQAIQNMNLMYGLPETCGL